MLLRVDQAPTYMREDSITTGYRKKLSYKACFSSWFWIHNETLNIWTHLIGFGIFVCCLFWVIWSPPRQVNSILELIPLIVQLLSYMACMLSSTLFHTFSCHSEDVHKYWRYTDHFGILAALFGTYVSLISNTFTCFPPWKYVHLSVVIALFIWVILFKCISTKKKSSNCEIPLDIFIYVATYSAVPIAHWAWLQGGIMQPVVLAKLQQIIIPFIAGTIGLFFYVTHFPERIFKAGSVDIVGSSHQIWHVLIWLGMALWYKETSFSFAEETNRDCSNLMTLSGSIKNNQTLVEQWFAGFLPQYNYLTEQSPSID